MLARQFRPFLIPCFFREWCEIHVENLGMRTSRCAITVQIILATGAMAQMPTVTGIEPQPLMAQASRVDEALAFLGNALADADRAKLAALNDAPHTDALVADIQDILDPYCLAFVHINPEARVKVHAGPAQPVLLQHGWKSFLIKVHNEAGSTAPLEWESPNAAPALHRSRGGHTPHEDSAISPGELAQRFLELTFYRARPMNDRLSGYPLEYQILQMYSTDSGPRDVELGFHVGQGTQDIGFRNSINLLFQCMRAVKVVFDVRDHDGEPAMASFTIRDNVDRAFPLNERGDVEDYRIRKAEQNAWFRPGIGKSLTGIYPLPSRRVAAKDEFPDFFFQPQIYRADGEHVYLPPGEYTVTYTRGPEYVPQTRSMTVLSDVPAQTESFQLERWTHLAAMGWYSGDHHVHAGGCSHYESPTAGVDPNAMIRQAIGEDLNVACVLTWGPCWYHQKSFFEGKLSELSTEENLMRYDVEVSGFPSSHAGHVCLLRLKEDDYPGTTLVEEWPSFTLPVLQWAKEQGGVTGYAHSGWGLEPVEPVGEIPNYVMAKFDGIGANEYIVTVTHDTVDFISAGDTPVPWEMNIWYHTLNCGFRTAISGETDFPCIFDERVGMARSYAKLGDSLTFDAFTDEIVAGRVYVSDGRSHIVDFAINDTPMGGEVSLDTPGDVTVTARVSAYLPEIQDEAGATVAAQELARPPYWHIERARVGDSRTVTLELVMNGYPITTQEIVADGEWRNVSFNVPVAHSSWLALRVLASSHTNPIFAIVDGKPIRASKRSAQWCRAAVDTCWEMKQAAIRDDERAAAAGAYEHARNVYDRILGEAIEDTESVQVSSNGLGR